MIFIVLFLLFSVGKTQTFSLFSFPNKVNLNDPFWCSNSFNEMRFTNTPDGIIANFHTQTYCGGTFTDVTTPFPVTTIKNLSCNSAQPNAIGTYYDFYGDMKCNFEPPTPNNPANFVPPNQCIFGTQCFRQAQPNSWIMNTCVFYPRTGGILYLEQLFNVQNDYVLPWFCRIDYPSQPEAALRTLTYCYHTQFGSKANICYGNCGGCSPSTDAACYGNCPNFNSQTSSISTATTATTKTSATTTKTTSSIGATTETTMKPPTTIITTLPTTAPTNSSNACVSAGGSFLLLVLILLAMY